MASENPSRDTVVAWVTGLAGVSIEPEGLSDESKELLVSLAEDIIEMAEDIGLVYEDLEGMDVILELAFSAYDGTRRRLSTSDNILQLVEAFTQFVFNDMAVGQLPIEVVTSLYRFGVTSLDGLGTAVVTVPLSDVESAANMHAQQIALPQNYDSTAYKVVLTEILPLILDSSVDPLYQSVPLSVQVENSICNSTGGDISQCNFTITLENFDFGNAVVFEAFAYETECFMGIESNHTYSCPSGVNTTAYCNGTVDGFIISNCSVHVPTSVCESIGSYIGECEVLDFSETDTICTCSLPGSNEDFEMSYVSYASSTLEHYDSYFVPRDDSSSDDSRVWIVFIMVFSLAAFLMYAVYVKCGRGMKKTAISRRFSDISESSGIVLLESSLSYIYRSQPFLLRFKELLCAHHQWFSVLFHKSHSYPTGLQLFSLWCKIVLVFFFEAIIYNFADKNESRCRDDNLTKSDCMSKTSFLALGEPLCEWNVNSEGDGVCRFREPDDDSMRTLFVAVLVGIIIVPLWYPVDYTIHNVLGIIKTGDARVAVTDEESAHQASPSGGYRPTGGSSRLADSSEDDFNDLIQGARQYASTLEGKAQTDFRAAWCLYGNDDENVIVKNELRETRQTYGEEIDFIESSSVPDVQKSRALLYLFVADFLTGSSHAVFKAVHERKRHRPVESSISQKLLGWNFLGFANLGLLVYVMMFWYRQSYERQFAFFVSFMIWLMLDVFVVTMLMFIWFHIALPLWAHADVKRAVTKVQRVIKSSGGTSSVSSFNAAKYLFASHRLALLAPTLEESAAILRYSTVWPRHCALSERGGQVVREKCTSGLVNSLVLKLTGMHILLQDVLVALVLSFLVGGLSLIHVEIYRIQQGYAAIPIALIFLLLIIYSYCYLAMKPTSMDTTPVIPDDSPQNEERPVQSSQTDEDSVQGKTSKKIKKKKSSCRDIVLGPLRVPPSRSNVHTEEAVL